MITLALVGEPDTLQKGSESPSVAIQRRSCNLFSDRFDQGKCPSELILDLIWGACLLCHLHPLKKAAVGPGAN